MSERTRRGGIWSGSIRRLLVQLLLALLIPVLLVQSAIYYRHFQRERASELRANLEVARAVAAAFAEHIRDIRSEELTVGEASLAVEPSAWGQLGAVLSRSAERYPDIVSLSLVDVTGRVRVSSRGGLVGRDWSAAPWLRQLQSGRSWVITDVVRSRSPSEEVFQVASAIRDQDQRLLGSVVAVVDATRLTGVLPIRRPGRGAFALIDSSGWLVRRFPISLPYEQRDWGRLYEITRAALQGKERSDVIFAFYERNEYRFVAQTPIAIGGTPIGWVASASRPEGEAIAAIVRDIALDSALLLITVCAALLLTLVLSERITTPLRRLRGYAAAVGQGRDAPPLPASGPAELVELAASLGQMGELVRQREEQQQRLLATETARARDARLLATILNHARPYVAYLDADLRFVRTNETYAHAVGARPEDLVGRSYAEVWDDPVRQATLANVLATGETVDFFEHRFQSPRHPAMASQYWDWSAVPIVRDDGAVEGVVVSARDVTQQVTSRQQVAEAERLVSTIIENTETHLVYLDRDFTFLRVNAAYARGCRKTPGELVGHNHFEFYPHAENQAIFERVRDTGEPATFIEKPFVFPDQPERGTTYWDWTLTPVKDESGAVVGLVFSLTDVTERVRTRDKLLAAERARTELAETLAAEINHRMKNNLMLISAVLELQAGTEQDGPAGEALRQAVSRISALSVVHEQMSRGETDSVDVGYVLRRVTNMVAEALSHEPVKLLFSSEKLFASARASSAVAIVANELMTNAIKHGESAEDGRLEIRVEFKSDESRGQAVLRIWNSGNPLPASFQLGQQQGTGLQIAEAIVTGQLRGALTLGAKDGGTLCEVTMDLHALG